MDKTKNFAFIVPTMWEDPNQDYVSAFFAEVQSKYPQLTIVGLEQYDKYTVVPKDSMNAVRPGSVIEVANNREYDIDWFGTEYDAAINGVHPKYNLKYDWAEIMAAVDNYARANYPIAYFATANVREITPTVVPYGIKQDGSIKTVTLPGYPTIVITDTFVKIGMKIYPLIISRSQDKKYSSEKEYFKAYNQLKTLEVIIVK